ncbi:MAG: 2-C-methyl-D-erythritol 4-phosphate cytidylyltransferase [candidate division Zixibacteria bacterium]|nr:2-C-methyl-D-erythritol 4-phosphate cytidylyltransferase [candidate division Zixibacteria bacterium]
MKTTALIVAAGSSVRFGGPVPKQYVAVGGRPLLAWTLERFEQARSIDSIVLVVAEDQLLNVSDEIIDGSRSTKVVRVIAGGATRQQSVLRGLESLPESTQLVAIHDGARPLTSPLDIDSVVQAAAVEKAAILASRVPDTLKKVADGCVMSTLNRNDLWLAQTPQVFERELILAVHRRAAREGIDVTDDATLVEATGYKVRVVESTSLNIKVTTRDDLRIVEALLKGSIDG